MLAYRYPIIAREGWLWIVIVAITAGIAYALYGLTSIPLWGLVLFFLFLFRDPVRKIPASPLGIVSPVDGKVIAIEPVHDDYLNRPAICITIKMGLTSVYSAHSPLEGKVTEQWLGVPRKIQYPSTNKNPKASISVTTYAQWIQSDEGDDVVLVMGANTILPKPQCYAHSGERVGQGQRCGFIHFGTQVDVLLPESVRINVEVGDHLTAGADIIATLVRANVAPSPAAEVVNA